MQDKIVKVIDLVTINPMQYGRKDHATSFSLAFSTNERISYQNFLNFSFNNFATLI